MDKRRTRRASADSTLTQLVVRRRLCLVIALTGVLMLGVQEADARPAAPLWNEGRRCCLEARASPRPARGTRALGADRLDRVAAPPPPICAIREMPSPSDGATSPTASDGATVLEFPERRSDQPQLDEQAITARAATRYLAFLRAELAQIPVAHHLHQEYAAQLEALLDRYPLGPRALRP
jgi:hypothetical protein